MTHKMVPNWAGTPLELTVQKIQIKLEESFMPNDQLNNL